MSRLVHRGAGVEVTLQPRCCVLRLDAPHEVTGFAVIGGGVSVARLLAIHEVRNAELPLEVDPVAYARSLHAERVGDDGVVLLTSRSLHDVDVGDMEVDGVRATALATVGLSNALRVGDRPGPIALPGAINLAVRVSEPLVLEARLEAMTLVAEARTAAVLASGIASRRSGRPATGTGTDAIVLLSPRGEHGAPYAGKHTAIGAAVGAACEAALDAAIARWFREVAPSLALDGGSA